METELTIEALTSIIALHHFHLPLRLHLLRAKVSFYYLLSPSSLAPFIA